jgi:hypothetical protein
MIEPQCLNYATVPTFVNNGSVRQRGLTEGDVVRIGPYRLVVQNGEIEYVDKAAGILLQALNLSKRVGKKTILHDVSLIIQPREFVAIVGVFGTRRDALVLRGDRPGIRGCEAGRNRRAVSANTPADRAAIHAVGRARGLHHRVLRAGPVTPEAEGSTLVAKPVAAAGHLYQEPAAACDWLQLELRAVHQPFEHLLVASAGSPDRFDQLPR